MRERTRSSNLNPHRIPNVAKYRAIAALSSTWSRMVNSTDFAAPDGCWEWKSTISADGYGVFGHHEYGPVLAHRLALHIVGRPVPADMSVDHLCRNRRCVNPSHMEIVTPVENVMRGNCPMAINARKTHCVNGHEYTPDNTGIAKSKTKVGVRRYCKQCAHDQYMRGKVA